MRRSPTHDSSLNTQHSNQPQDPAIEEADEAFFTIAEKRRANSEIHSSCRSLQVLSAATVSAGLRRALRQRKNLADALAGSEIMTRANDAAPCAGTD